MYCKVFYHYCTVLYIAAVHPHWKWYAVSSCVSVCAGAFSACMCMCVHVCACVWVHVYVCVCCMFISLSLPRAPSLIPCSCIICHAYLWWATEQWPKWANILSWKFLTRNTCWVIIWPKVTLSWPDAWDHQERPPRERSNSVTGSYYI